MNVVVTNTRVDSRAKYDAKTGVLLEQSGPLNWPANFHNNFKSFCHMVECTKILPDYTIQCSNSLAQRLFCGK